MHHDLDDELTSAFARSASPGEQASLYAMVRETETETEPRGRVRKHRGRGVTALLTVGALGLGGGTAAFAAPMVWDWLTFTPDASTTVVFPSGVTCDIAYIIREGDAHDAKTADAAAFAAEHLRTLDLSTLPVEQTLAEMKATDMVSAAEPLDTQMQAALSRSVIVNVNAALEDEGLGGIGVGMEGQGKCE